MGRGPNQPVPKSIELLFCFHFGQTQDLQICLIIHGMSDQRNDCLSAHIGQWDSVRLKQWRSSWKGFNSRQAFSDYWHWLCCWAWDKRLESNMTCFGSWTCLDLSCPVERFCLPLIGSCGSSQKQIPKQKAVVGPDATLFEWRVTFETPPREQSRTRKFKFALAQRGAW